MTMTMTMTMTSSDLGEREFAAIDWTTLHFLHRKIPEKSHTPELMEINQTDSEQHESLIFKDIRNQNDTAKHLWNSL